MRKIIDPKSLVSKELENPPGEPPMTAMLMAVSLMMNGMEALGSFLTGSPRNNKRFCAFVDKYMTNWNVEVTTPQHGSKPLAEILWGSYRNGLAHSFAIVHAGIEPDANNNTHHIANGVLQINAWKLFHDLECGVSQMFKDVHSDPNAKKSFLDRFNKVYKY